MTISPNRFYRTRDGHKARIYATDGEMEWPIHGACLIDNYWVITSWTSGGFISSAGEDEFDIVSEWIDKPEVDWSLHSPWIVAISASSSGVWYEWKVVPTCTEVGWNSYSSSRGIVGNPWSVIPEKYAPKFSGDWKDSLVERPA